MDMIDVMETIVVDTLAKIDTNFKIKYSLTRDDEGVITLSDFEERNGILFGWIRTAGNKVRFRHWISQFEASLPFKDPTFIYKSDPQLFEKSEKLIKNLVMSHFTARSSRLASDKLSWTEPRVLYCRI
jgi:hypothetical protein